MSDRVIVSLTVGRHHAELGSVSAEDLGQDAGSTLADLLRQVADDIARHGYDLHDDDERPSAVLAAERGWVEPEGWSS